MIASSEIQGYGTLFSGNQLGKSAGRNNPADEGGRRTAQVLTTTCVLDVKHSSPLPA